MPTPITIKNYEGSLRRLREGLGIKDGIAFLTERVDDVIAWINSQKKSDNTLKSYYVAIKSTIRGTVAPELFAKYEDQFVAIQKKVYDAGLKQVLTKMEEVKYLPWNDILALSTKLNPTSTDKSERMDHLLFCLYTMIPPIRADYSPMMVVKRVPKKNDCNYVVLRKSNPIFILNEYKTSSTFGKLELSIPPKLMSVITSYVADFPSTFLLTDLTADTPPLTPSSLSQKIVRMFVRLCGKPIGISMLRHSYITFRRSGVEMPLLEKQELSRQMQHSVLTNELYRKLDA